MHADVISMTGRPRLILSMGVLFHLLLCSTRVPVRVGSLPVTGRPVMRGAPSRGFGLNGFARFLRYGLGEAFSLPLGRGSLRVSL